ncbi:MAG: hypothetical protein IJ131_07330 [Eggerthellaceae bacterium]|nr:hypothetical protein [Eggerthellaceae bacterium]
MYHPYTTEQIRERQRSRVRVAVASVVAFVLAALFFFAAHLAMREQGAVSMRAAILDTAKQCCAVEGAYPHSMDYLVDHYGLVVNDADYQIAYECYADNILPSVVVTPR